MEDEELKLLYIQLFGTALFAINLAISFYLTYEEIRKRNNQEVDVERDNKASLISRTIATISILIFLYISVKNYEIAKIEQKSDLELFRNEVIISILSLIAGLIAMYNTMKKVNGSLSVSDIENPQV